MTRVQRLVHARLWILLALALAIIVAGGVVVRQQGAEAVAAARASGAHR